MSKRGHFSGRAVRVSRLVRTLCTPVHAHLKKNDYLAPTSASQPSVDSFGSYLVMLQPHIPSGSPGVRNTKNVHRAVYDAVHIKTIFFYFLFLTNLRFFLHFWNLGTSSGVLKQKKVYGVVLEKKLSTKTCFAVPWEIVFFRVHTRWAKGPKRVLPCLGRVL